MPSREPYRGHGTAFLDEYKRRPRTPFYRTGIPALDMALHGVYEGQTLLIGGATGSSKTGLVERLAINISPEVPVTIALTEMGEHRFRERCLAKLHGSSIDGYYQDLGSEFEPYVERAQQTNAAFDLLPIQVFEPIGDTKLTARTCFEAAWRNRSRVLIIDLVRDLHDWLDDATGGPKAATQIADEIRRLTRDSGFAVILVQQLKIDPTRVKLRPNREQFYDTRKLAQNADAIVLIHRPFRGEGPADNVAELIIEKNRNGAEGVVHVGYRGAMMDFRPMSAQAVAEVECCKGAREKKRKREGPDPVGTWATDEEES